MENHLQNIPQGWEKEDEHSFVNITKEHECPFVDFEQKYGQKFVNLIRTKSAGEVLFNCCTKYYPDGRGGWYPVKRVIFDQLIFNPNRAERIDVRDGLSITKPRNPEAPVSAKSYNRARQSCFDYLMCNPDLDTFVTFTIDPSKLDAKDYDGVVRWLSVWLDNRVRRHSLKYILVPERHKSGAIHFHGIMNRDGLKLVPSGKWKVGKYTLSWEDIAPRLRAGAQEIFNVKDLPLGFSTALHIEGEGAQTKISKYIWKYMTKQGRQKIGGRFYLHGGDLVAPKLEYSNESFSETDGTVVSYGGISCKLASVEI